MSHHHLSEPVICPNCGYHAVENYCARCGQETHLHKDTFWGLIVHFAGHYLHYDSKFWKTLRALWFSPGMLTKAYFENKRMRYIPPISLYIFVSFVFFFTGALVPQSKEDATAAAIDSTARNIKLQFGRGNTVKGNTVQQSKINAHSRTPADPRDTLGDTKDVWRWLVKHKLVSKSYEEMTREHPDLDEYFGEQITHLLPKIFFFMIPFMALILKVLFLRRRELYYVNHVIFSLHFHSFWFSAFLLSEINPFVRIDAILGVLLGLWAAVYFVFALRNVYNIKTFKAIAYMVLTSFFYLLFFVLALMTLVGVIFFMA